MPNSVSTRRPLAWPGPLATSDFNIVLDLGSGLSGIFLGGNWTTADPAAYTLGVQKTITATSNVGRQVAVRFTVTNTGVPMVASNVTALD